MSAVDICLCILLVAGAFALITIGIVFIRLLNTLDEINTSLNDMRVTLGKANETIESVNYKLELLNAPFERVSNFFQDDNSPVAGGWGRTIRLVSNAFRAGWRSNRRHS